METHFPGSKSVLEDDVKDAEVVENHRRFRTMNDYPCVLDTIFTQSKVEWAVNSFEPFKSPGKDGIFPTLLQKGGKVLLNSLTRIFKASLSQGYIPTIWTQIRVVFIPKAGKRDKIF